MGRRVHGILVAGGLAAAVAGCGGGGDAAPAAPVATVPGRTYGGAGTDQAWSVQQTLDGGYVFAGFTNSAGAGGFDAWVVKTDAAGAVTGQRTFGTSGNDFAFGIAQTADGGYILAGVDGEVRGIAPTAGVWLPLDASGDLTLRKLNADLSLAWEVKVGATTSGGSSYPYAVGCAVQQTADGGYVVAGATGTGGGGGQTLLLKADSGGTVQWYAYLPGELGTGVRQTTDGGYAVATSGAGLVKVSSGGLQVWNPTLLGSALGVWACADGGAAVTGEAAGPSGDVYVAKVAAGGAVSWERSFGTPSGDQGFAIQQTADGGFILTGAGGTIPNHRFELSLIRLDAAGATLWERYHGGTGDEIGRSIRQTSDGGFIVAGSTTSKGAGGTDAYLVKTDASGVAQW